MGNEIISVVDGVACVDVSTPRYPRAMTFVDVEDLPRVFDGGPSWGAVKTKQNSERLYVQRKVGGRDGEYRLLHRDILGLKVPEIQGDHRDGDGLNNRRSNLREASNQQNSHNGSGHSDGSSPYKGVSWDKDRSRWKAMICRDGHNKFIGRFDTEEEAARAYDAAAAKLFGVFARLNYPTEAVDGQ